jgi:nucleoside-diphosphate-sugar epimerase
MKNKLADKTTPQAQNPPKAETVLVTGGTGFLASWTIIELLQRGFKVRTTVRSLSKEKEVRATIATIVDPADQLTFFAADLTSDTGWDAAVEGCDYVLHIASPLGGDNPKDPDALIVPARDGTLRVLRASTRAGVKRVVITSSCAAVTPSVQVENYHIDESFWTNPEDKALNTYRKSKTLSEMAAWQFMKSYNGPTTLTTILPGAIFGPTLSRDNLGSVQVVGRLFSGRMLGVPKIAFEIVDVRDLADLHIRAMTSSQAAGQRFIAVGENLWMIDIAKMLHAQFGDAAKKVPTRTVPDFIIRLLSNFAPELKTLTPMLGRKHRHTSEKAEKILDWHTRPATETIVDCIKSLISLNAI